MKKGTFYCVGVGPGDPKLMTFLAAETIRNCDVAALPSSGAKENAAQKIAAKFLEGKKLLYCDMPMIRDKVKLEEAHQASAQQIREELDQGRDVAFLTLGDPSIYATPMYLHHILRQQGYETRMIPGVPSFCAAAAALDVSLCEGGEVLQIIPASYPDAQKVLNAPGNKVLMKSGKSMRTVREQIDTDRFDAMAVECCGMEQEKIHRSLDSLDETSSYFSVVVVKERASSAEN
ncbi:MAG: precorrin-2 C(20)-methyltransferase [Oscillospiraceae bacterium]